MDAEIVASSWGREVERSQVLPVLDPGDEFKEAPGFELLDGWLVATDRRMGQRLACPFASAELRDRVVSGELQI